MYEILHYKYSHIKKKLKQEKKCLARGGGEHHLGMMIYGWYLIQQISGRDIIYTLHIENVHKTDNHIYPPHLKRKQNRQSYILL